MNKDADIFIPPPREGMSLNDMEQVLDELYRQPVEKHETLRMYSSAILNARITHEEEQQYRRISHKFLWMYGTLKKTPQNDPWLKW